MVPTPEVRFCEEEEGSSMIGSVEEEGLEFSNMISVLMLL